MLLVCTPGCSQAAPEAAACASLADAEADVCWLASLSPGDSLDTVAQHCARVSDPWTRDVCLVGGAAGWARTTWPDGGNCLKRERCVEADRIDVQALEQAFAVCSQSTSGATAEECRFQVLDAVVNQVDPKSWVDACEAQVSTLSEACVQHGATAWMLAHYDRGTPWFDEQALPEQLASLTKSSSGSQLTISALRTELTNPGTSHTNLHVPLGMKADERPEPRWRSSEATPWW